MAKRKKESEGSRPYKTDYGMTQGHCESPQGAVMSALRYMRLNGRKHTVIEQPHGPPIDVYWSGFWGVTVQVRKVSNVIPIKRAKA